MQVHTLLKAGRTEVHSYSDKFMVICYVWSSIFCDNTLVRRYLASTAGFLWFTAEVFWEPNNKKMKIVTRLNQLAEGDDETAFTKEKGRSSERAVES